MASTIRFPDRMGTKSPQLPLCGSPQKQQAGLTVQSGGALRQGLHSSKGAVCEQRPWDTE